MVYWTYVTTNVSMWCWVLMSAMRYMAVYHPFLQLRVSFLPRRGLQLIILLSLLLNATFIGAVEFRDNKCQVERRNVYTLQLIVFRFGSGGEGVWLANGDLVASSGEDILGLHRACVVYAVHRRTRVTGQSARRRRSATHPF
jgi:hypothetical protein